MSLSAIPQRHSRNLGGERKSGSNNWSPKRSMPICSASGKASTSNDLGGRHHVSPFECDILRCIARVIQSPGGEPRRWIDAWRRLRGRNVEHAGPERGAWDGTVTMRVLITGAGGFVGRHLVTKLQAVLPVGAEIIATGRTEFSIAGPVVVRQLDITDADAVVAEISQSRPTHVVHLAGIAAIPEVGANVLTAWTTHLFGTLYLARAILKQAPDCLLIFAGSGQVYGDTAKSGLPLDETALLAPVNEYASSKAAADLALGALAKQGLRVVRFRPFNHTGPGQTEDFVVPSFAAQIARIEAGRHPPVIRVGNLEAQRDFLDVRDVVAAYALAVLKSDIIMPGTILNVASGIPRRVRDVLGSLLARSSLTINVELDPDRMRPSDTPRFVGDATQTRELLAWRPEWEFDRTLASVMEHWRGIQGGSARA